MSDALCCDTCKDFAETERRNTRTFGARAPLPVGWVRVYVEGEGEQFEAIDAAGDFCSYKCAALYLSLKDAA